MSELIVISEQNQETLIKKVSDVYQRMLIDLSKSYPNIISAWPGGRSLLKFFPAFNEVLSTLPIEIVKKQQFFQVDERVSQDFNRVVLEDNFFSNLAQKKIINRSQVHYYPTDMTPELAVLEYSNLLASFGSRFNYVMLGAGNPHIRDLDGKIIKYDCHLAGIFANHPSSKATGSAFYYYFDSPKPPPGRITATYNLLSASDWCFLFIMGEEKKDVLREFLDPSVSVDTTPIKIAQTIKNCVLITDQKI
jgi:6-phosphogluconolactonase